MKYLFAPAATRAGLPSRPAWHRWGGVLAACVFLFGVMRMTGLPGIYMDGVNPDYVAAVLLHPQVDNPMWVQPYRGLPLLGSPYHGMQNAYVGLPVFWWMGFSVEALRLAQSLFGVASVLLVYRIVHRLTMHRWLATAAALGLACDVGFLMAFRTQHYIVQGGMTWLLLSVLCMLPRPDTKEADDGTTPLRFAASGLFGGLAIYGYFVLGFFMPALAAGVLALARPGKRLRMALWWLLGFGIGLLPYAWGYGSMVLALDGIDGTKAHFGQMVQRLSPFSTSGGNGWNTAAYLLDMARLALSNGGNEALILAQTVPAGAWPRLKLNLLLLALAVGGTWLALCWRRTPAPRRAALALVLALPVSYGLCSGIFGRRLGAHHFTVLLPLLYLIAAVVLGLLLSSALTRWRQSEAGRFRRSAAAALCGLLLLGNLHQQGKFFDVLARTGGVGYMSHAVTLMAQDARSQAGQAVYLFPEWGFLMPFIFLTGNRIPVWSDIDPAWLGRYRGKVAEVRMAVWTQEQLDVHRAVLERQGIRGATVQTYYRLDGAPALYLLKAPL